MWTGDSPLRGTLWHLFLAVVSTSPPSSIQSWKRHCHEQFFSLSIFQNLVCVSRANTVVSYQNESFSSKWELPCLPPSSLELWRRERASRQLSFWWKALILIGHYGTPSNQKLSCRLEIFYQNCFKPKLIHKSAVVWTNDSLVFFILWFKTKFGILVKICIRWANQVWG